MNAQNHLPSQYDWFTRVEGVLEDLLHALRNNQDCVSERNAVKKFKDEYQSIYLRLHDKSRLNATKENKKNRLLSDTRVLALRKLATIEMLSDQPLAKWEEKINNMKSCWQLTKEKLEHTPICQNCKFRPKDEPAVQHYKLDEMEDEIGELLQTWIETLLINFNDPEIKKNITLLRHEHMELIEVFIKKQKLELPINIKLIDAINELLQGIEKVSFSISDLEEMMSNGNPLTVDELKRRFDKLVKKKVGAQPKSNIRILLNK